MKKFMIPLLAIVLAVAGSAFTTIQKATTTGDLVWFLVDPITGEALDPNNGGVQTDTAPTNCPDNIGDFCATALSISDGDAEFNSTGYRIMPGVDITNSAEYDDIARKQ